MKCVGNKCRYFLLGDRDVGNICSLVVDEFCMPDDECIGYTQLQEEIDRAAKEVTYWTAKFEKLERLKGRIGRVEK